MSFVGGPCTQGPGQVVSDDLREPIRSHHDLVNESVPFHAPGLAFFRKLTQRCVRNGHCFDQYVCAGNQTGVLELRDLVNQTGGVLVLADRFDGCCLVGFFFGGGGGVGFTGLCCPLTCP